MKEYLRHLFILVLCVGTYCVLPAQTSTEYLWSRKADFIGGKAQGAVTFALNGEGYVCMASSGKDFWKYTPATNKWTKLPNFPGKIRTDATAFTVNGKAYLVGGAQKTDNGNDDLTDVWEYDPVEGQWQQKADFPGGTRHGAVGFSIDGKGYIGIGEQSGRITYYNDLWQYNPANDKWSKMADFPEKGRSDAGVFVIGKNAYIMFGDQGMSLKVSKRSVYMYNSEKNTWAEMPDFPGLARTGASVFALGDRGFVFGGDNGGSQRLDDFWVFNPKNETWQQQQPDSLPPARSNAFCFVSDSTVYLGTGKIKNSIFNWGITDFWAMGTRTDIDFKAKLLYESNNRKLPLVQQGISLVSQEKVLQKTITDSTGSFGFKKVDTKGSYKLVLDKNSKLPDDAKVSLAQQSGKIVASLQKNNDGQFSYQVSKLEMLEEDDSYFNLQYFIKSKDTSITITTPINYPSASWTLSDTAKDILYQLVVCLKQYPDIKLQVASHTDAVGNEKANMILSEKRAKTVVDYLVSYGISPSRISGKGYGDTRLLNKCGHGVKCSDEENAVNRRTEFKFIKP